jgi:protein-S-isoprenylcysteine O-methyltransferase Ste14
MTDQQGQTSRSFVRRGVVRLVFVVVFVGVPLFSGAGTLGWTRGWMFLALLVASFGLNMAVMVRRNPALLRERWKRRSDTKSFDKVFGIAYLTSTLAMLAVAGLDSGRYRWTTMTDSLLYVGVLLHFMGLIPVVWSMMCNPHLETTVRVQRDRNHRVVSDGPYQYVRHPMYVGMILMYLGWPLVLGSWAAFAVSLSIGVLLCLRTAMEDATLQNELAGYAEFCQQTRYRLIPGLW